MADPAAVRLEGFRMLFIQLIECDFFRTFIVAVRGLTQLYVQFLDIYLKYYLPKLLRSHLLKQGTRCENT